ncbi:putative bax protein [Vibrio cholerae]|nr:putative bax protein [Vibrio cholerae]CSC24175.1 putative bax protein [Vibrio cholerae]
MSNGLLKYSERGEAYVRDLQAMMLANQEYWNDN